MRYILQTEDEQGTIGAQIKRWADEGKVSIIEKADPVVEIQAHLERVARALEVLRKAGYNKDVMRTYIKEKTKLSWANIDSMFGAQDEFFKQIGVLK